MSTVTVTSADTLVLNGRVFNDFGTDDVTAVSFPNDLITLKTGKNGNTIYAKNEPGQNATAVLRLMRGSSDDQYMQAIIQASLKDFPSLQLLSGSFVKRLGDGLGNVVSDVYALAGGVISKNVEGKENVSGDVVQAESIYNIKFASAVRVIQ